MTFNEAKAVLNSIEDLKRHCKTPEDVQDLRQLLPLLLDDDPQEVVAAHYAALELLTNPKIRVVPLELDSPVAKPSRTPQDVIQSPMPRDVIEIRERLTCVVTGESFQGDTLIRVIAVHEERVWCKEYGKGGHDLILLTKWQKRLSEAVSIILLPTTENHQIPPLKQKST